MNRYAEHIPAACQQLGYPTAVADRLGGLSDDELDDILNRDSDARRIINKINGCEEQSLPGMP